MNVSLAYFMYNIIISDGQKFVEDSFKSLSGQSDDIMVMDYDSQDKDKLKELAEKYNFRFINVKQTPNVFFHISKMINKSLLNAKHDIFVKLTPDVIYPLDFVQKIKKFYETHEPTKECGEIFYNKWRLGGKKETDNDITYYKPTYMTYRGVDERLSWMLGEQWYSRLLFLNVLNYKSYPLITLEHRPHKPRGHKWKWNRENQRKIIKYVDVHVLLNRLKNNFNENIKKVKNSYW